MLTSGGEPTSIRLRSLGLFCLALSAFVVICWACSGAGGGSTSEESAAGADSDALPQHLASGTIGWPTDWSVHSVDLNELTVGLKGAEDMRDTIPPIDEPTFESVEDAGQWLGSDDLVAQFELNGDARAYPLRIIAHHEIVNDWLGGIPVAITYCPQCTSAVGFDRRIDGQALRFGVSGLLRLNDLVMWDDATTSLWQQLSGVAIVGELTGQQLELISTPIVRFGDFAERFPNARVLSRDTGFGLSYDAPYALEEE